MYSKIFCFFSLTCLFLAHLTFCSPLPDNCTATIDGGGTVRLYYFGKLTSEIAVNSCWGNDDCTLKCGSNYVASCQDILYGGENNTISVKAQCKSSGLFGSYCPNGVVVWDCIGVNSNYELECTGYTGLCYQVGNCGDVNYYCQSTSYNHFSCVNNIVDCTCGSGAPCSSVC